MIVESVVESFAEVHLFHCDKQKYLLNKKQKVADTFAGLRYIF